MWRAVAQPSLRCHSVALVGVVAPAGLALRHLVLLPDAGRSSEVRIANCSHGASCGWSVSQAGAGRAGECDVHSLPVPVGFI